MITWMQRHKKWLITTIWISTIAFVGAGFVGWGSYDFGKTGGDIAKVGNTTVKIKDVQNQYQNLYSQYKKMFGEQFNNEMAKSLKLEDAAYDNAITNAMLLNYANELGLIVTDKEVAKELVKINSFMKDGKFSKEIYIKVLSQNRTTPVEFENNIKQDLLINKVKSLISKFTQTTQTEVKDIQSVLFALDKLKIKIIDQDKINITINKTDLKKYWEENKANYLSDELYVIERYILNISNDSKKSKKEALKKYLKLKKGTELFSKQETLTLKQLSLSDENIEKFKDASIGKVLKPMKEANTYVIIKLLKKLDPQALSFDDAKKLVTIDFEKQQKEIKLNKMAKNTLKNFKGNDLGYISRESVDKIKGLTTPEAMEFLNKLFLTTTPTGIINITSKAVVYKVEKSKLAKYDSKKDSVVKNTMSNIKFQSAMDNFMKQLKTKYEIVRY
jgi:peptidyl-prolyl cis-trans isomerase D